MAEDTSAVAQKQIEASLLAMAVGNAITHWAVLEDALSRIFSFAVSGGQYSFGARRAFWVPHSFAMKVQMVDEALAVELRGYPEMVLELWRGLRKKLLDLNSIRNRIAHGMVMNVRTNPDQPSAKHEVYLQPFPGTLWAGSTKRDKAGDFAWSDQASDRMTLIEVDQAGRDFQQAMFEIVEFANLTATPKEDLIRRSLEVQLKAPPIP